MQPNIAPERMSKACRDALSWRAKAAPSKPGKLRQLGALHYVMLLGVVAVVVWAMVSVYLLLTV